MTYGQILNTTDSGNSWQPLLDSDVAWRALFFVNTDTGWVVGVYNDSEGTHYGTIIKTTNGGNSWETQLMGEQYSPGFILFVNDSIGWVLDRTRILKTYDGGVNWTIQQNSPPSQTALFFLDENIGWVVGNNGIIFKTFDGGENWSSQNSGTSNHLNSVYFTSLDTGWVVGDGALYNNDPGIVLKTNDSGVTWNPVPTGKSGEFNSVFFTSSNVGWIAGTGGTILKTTTGGGVTSIEDSQIANIPELFELKQNYPNPFNPSTTIEFTLPKAGYVTLKIYNILGQEIITLVSEKLSAGNHKCYWNVNGMASGLYFYKIESDRHSQMKKALLIK
jgi:photosystem II stability/assembly factor-like uncharacterized protein